jgi:hypothetical protein
MVKKLVIGAVIAVAVVLFAREVSKRARGVCERCGCAPSRCGCEAPEHTEDREEAVAAAG